MGCLSLKAAKALSKSPVARSRSSSDGLCTVPGQMALQVIPDVVAVAVSCAGSVMVTVSVVEQPFASTIVKECVPAGFVKVPMPLYGGVPPAAVMVTVELSP